MQILTDKQNQKSLQQEIRFQRIPYYLIIVASVGIIFTWSCMYVCVHACAYSFAVQENL